MSGDLIAMSGQYYSEQLFKIMLLDDNDYNNINNNNNNNSEHSR